MGGILLPLWAFVCQVLGEMPRWALTLEESRFPLPPLRSASVGSGNFGPHASCYLESGRHFRESPTSSDEEIFQELVSNGIERVVAARLVEFLPMALPAFCFSNTAVRV